MIGVLRLGHRVKRDVRITTHVFLAARAFGADSAILSGEPDDEIIESVGKVSKNWGGKFSVVYQEDWRKVMREAKKKKVGIVHLTMYGELVQKKIPEIRKKWKNLLVVVGAGKVPGEAYRMSDYNISVTSQPHSEVAALADRRAAAERVWHASKRLSEVWGELCFVLSEDRWNGIEGIHDVGDKVEFRLVRLGEEGVERAWVEGFAEGAEVGWPARCYAGGDDEWRLFFRGHFRG